MNQERSQAGFSLIELMIVLVTLGVLLAIAIPMMGEAILRARIGAATAEARAIHSAFKSYAIDLSVYPDSGGFSTTTMEPLVSLGYYDGRIIPHLAGGTLDGYGSPAGGHEYWLEFTLARDANVRFLVTDSDDAPLSGGTFFDGIVLYRSGVLVPL